MNGCHAVDSPRVGRDHHPGVDCKTVKSVTSRRGMGTRPDPNNDDVVDGQVFPFLLWSVRVLGIFSRVTGHTRRHSGLVLVIRKGFRRTGVTRLTLPGVGRTTIRVSCRWFRVSLVRWSCDL